MTERTFLVFVILFRGGRGCGRKPADRPKTRNESTPRHLLRFSENKRVFPVQTDVFWPGLTFGQGTEIA